MRAEAMVLEPTRRPTTCRLGFSKKLAAAVSSNFTNAVNIIVRSNVVSVVSKAALIWLKSAWRPLTTPERTLNACHFANFPWRQPSEIFVQSACFAGFDLSIISSIYNQVVFAALLFVDGCCGALTRELGVPNEIGRTPAGTRGSS